MQDVFIYGSINIKIQTILHMDQDGYVNRCRNKSTSYYAVLHSLAYENVFSQISDKNLIMSQHRNLAL